MRFAQRLCDELLIQRIQRAGVKYLGGNAVFLQNLGGGQSLMNHLSGCNNGHILTAALDVALSERDGLEAVHITLHRVHGLVLHKHDGVFIINGGEHKPQRILRGGGIYDLQAGNMGDPCLQGLRVLCGGTYSCAAGQAYHHGHGDFSAEHIAHLCRLIHQLIHAHRQEIAEHQLGNGAQAGGGGADSGANNGTLRNRGIPYPLVTKLIEHTGSNTKAAAEGSHILAKQQDTGIFAHPDAHAFTDRFCITHLFHLARTSSTISE